MSESVDRETPFFSKIEHGVVHIAVGINTVARLGKVPVDEAEEFAEEVLERLGDVIDELSEPVERASRRSRRGRRSRRIKKPSPEQPRA